MILLFNILSSNKETKKPKQEAEKSLALNIFHYIGMFVHSIAGLNYRIWKFGIDHTAKYEKNRVVC